MPKTKKKVELEHRVFGLGTVQNRFVNDLGDACLTVAFADRTRCVLLWPDLWLSSLAEIHAAFEAAPAREVAEEGEAR